MGLTKRYIPMFRQNRHLAFFMFLVAVVMVLQSCKQGPVRVSDTSAIQIGVRPFYLIDKMVDSELKTKLKTCEAGPFYKTDFSLGHRGAALQFPEHTRESYIAAVRQGAGLLECDVTFTKDAELVCRHSQCDLHTTTNILETDLASQCVQPFVPATFDSVTGERIQSASAKCCTSDITLAEFKTLCGKMDASNADATTVEEYLKGTPVFRTDLYSSCGTVVSHKESVALFKKLAVKFVPELKSPDSTVKMPFDSTGDGVGDFTQQQYAQKMIDEYKQAQVDAGNVWAQSFNLDDILYWVSKVPDFGSQAVFLDARFEQGLEFVPSLADFEHLKSLGVRIIAPPIPILLQLDDDNNIVPSEYAILAKEAGLDIMTWTLERSGRLAEDMKESVDGQFYYQTILNAINNDGDMMETLDVLAKDVGVKGVFSDWPATVTYYANCMNLK